MNWMYKGKELTELPKGAIGFIYKIFYEDNNNTYTYYGKKLALTKHKKHFTKKEMKDVTDKRKKTYKMVDVELDWKSYKGSCKDSILDLCVMCEKEILEFCYSQTELTYKEAKILFKNDVLEDDKCLNANILGKFFKDKV